MTSKNQFKMQDQRHSGNVLNAHINAHQAHITHSSCSIRIHWLQSALCGKNKPIERIGRPVWSKDL